MVADICLLIVRIIYLVNLLHLSMQEPDICTKPTNKIRAFLEKRFKIDLSRFDGELLCNYYKYFDDSDLKMNSEENSIPSESMESDIIKELYKKTPLKKRPIQPSSLSPDEKKISSKPRACTVPEGRLSKRKMLKPTKKLIDSYVESTAVLEPAPKAMYVPVIKTSAEAKASSPVEMDNKAVNMAMAMAIPELKKTTCVETEVPSRIPKISKALCKRNFTKQEWEDFNLAIELQKEEFNLRERRPRRSTSNLRIKLKREKSPVKTEDVSTESMDSNSISSPEMPNEVGEKQGKQEIKRIPKQTSVNIVEGEKDASTCLFTGSHSQNMYILSPELANIVGHKKMSSGAIVDAMHYVFLERNLFEPDKKYVICDDELSEKLFAGKRRLRFDDVKNYLHKHLTLTD